MDNKQEQLRKLLGTYDEAKLREALRQLEEISEMDDQECDRLEAEFKARNIFK